MRSCSDAWREQRIQRAALAACSGAVIEDILRVLNDHMEAVRLIYPKEYDAVTRRIEDTKK